MTPFELLRFINNPQQLAAALMNDKQITKDPRAKKAIELIQNQDSKGLQSMAQNLCKEYGTTPEQIMASLQGKRI